MAQTYLTGTITGAMTGHRPAGTGQSYVYSSWYTGSNIYNTYDISRPETTEYNLVIYRVHVKPDGGKVIGFRIRGYFDLASTGSKSQLSLNARSSALQGTLASESRTFTNGYHNPAQIAISSDANKYFENERDVYIGIAQIGANRGACTVQIEEIGILTVPPDLSLSMSPESVTAGNRITALAGGRYGRSLNLTLTAGNADLTPTPITVDSDSYDIVTQISWFNTAAVTDDTMTITATVIDPEDGRTASAVFTLTRPVLGVTASPGSVGVGETLTLAFINRCDASLSVAVKCNGVTLTTFTASSDSRSFTVDSGWLSTIRDSYATLDITVTDATYGRAAQTSVSLSVHALDASINKSSVKTGDPIVITLNYRYGESVAIRFKDGSALITSGTYSQDSITITPDTSWFAATGNPGDSMTVSVEIACQSTGREDYLSFELTRPVLGVTATSPVTSGAAVTLTFAERNGAALTVVLKSGSTTLASPASFAADSLEVTTAHSWFQTAGVTARSYMTVTVEVTSSDGRSATCDFTLNAADAMKPTVGTISLSAVQPSADMESVFGQTYVQGYTRVKVSVSASALYDASIAAAAFSMPGGLDTAMAHNSSSGKWEGVSVNPVTVNGSITVRVTDSRGLTAMGTVTFSALTAYSAPGVSEVSFHRCRQDKTKDDSGGYCLISAKFTISPVEDKNSKSASIASSIYNDSVSMGSYTETLEWFFAADIEHSYEITLTAIDAITSTAMTVKLSTAGVIMDFLAGGKGIGLGKVAELQKCVEVNPEWRFKAATIELNGTDLGTLLAQIQQRLTNGGL